MRIVVVAEHDGTAVRGASLSALAFAQSVAAAAGGEVTWLVLGQQVDSVAQDAARLAPVLVVDSPALENPIAEPFARVISTVVKERGFELVAAASSTFAKDIVPRMQAFTGMRRGVAVDSVQRK